MDEQTVQTGLQDPELARAEQGAQRLMARDFDRRVAKLQVRSPF